MCGIAGIYNFSGKQVEKSALASMAASLAHRGPDGEGFFIEENIGLGHRRLAIIDLTPAGHQPMETNDGRYVISYNGEVYNFQAIRKELELLGISFKSKTDSEVVLNAYAHWGVKCLDKFNGMFAFAVWDKKEKTLFLARDRYGIKPLYYTIQNGALIFGSEIKAIIASKLFNPTLNKASLVEYLTFQNFFSDRNLFNDIFILPPGKYLTCNPSGNVKITQYWDFKFQQKISLSEDEAIEEIYRLLNQSIERQLISDVPVGAYLSGGIDSGLINLIASEQNPNMRSFTIGFDLNSASGIELGFDEREQAELLSYLARTEHYQMVLKAGDMERCLKKLVWHLEEPRVGQSYPNFYAASLASNFGKVVLSGTGGDEIFGGYPWRYYRSNDNDNFQSYIDHYYQYWQRLISNTELKAICKPMEHETAEVSTRIIFEDVFNSYKETLIDPEDYINHSLYFEAKTFLHGLLVMEDKLSMAHGLETRIPFLDNDLVDFTTQLPVSFKLNDLSRTVRIDENQPGKSEKFYLMTRDGKKILRKLIHQYAPKLISERKKQGFSAPDASWFKGESIEYVKSIVYDQNSPLYNFFDFTSVKKMVDEHIDDKKNRRLFIWSMIYLHNFFLSFNIQ